MSFLLTDKGIEARIAWPWPDWINHIGKRATLVAELRARIAKRREMLESGTFPRDESGRPRW